MKFWSLQVDISFNELPSHQLLFAYPSFLKSRTFQFFGDNSVSYHLVKHQASWTKYVLEISTEFLMSATPVVHLFSTLYVPTAVHPVKAYKFFSISKVYSEASLEELSTTAKISKKIPSFWMYLKCEFPFTD